LEATLGPLYALAAPAQLGVRWLSSDGEDAACCLLHARSCWLRSDAVDAGGGMKQNS
tara:strand:- start:559 stop:729 length:171 start_codon:yes stop_codon:yes gene_type:complete